MKFSSQFCGMLSKHVKNDVKAYLELCQKAVKNYF